MMLKESKEQVAVIGHSEWMTRLSQSALSKKALDQLVMNYLIIEGYKDTAEAFVQECGLDPASDLSVLEGRRAVRQAVQEGDVERAIELVNDLNPEILDTNPQLFFHLQQLRLIELIRENRVADALAFAKEDLGPMGEENISFLQELERTVTLLAFQNCPNSPVAYLLDPAQRQRTANELNAAILASQCQDKESRLTMLVKLLRWAQDLLKEKVECPAVSSILHGEVLAGAQSDLTAKED